MVSENQIKIVGTDYFRTYDDYANSDRRHEDNPGRLINYEGMVFNMGGDPRCIALWNMGAVVNSIPAFLNADGRWQPIQGANPVALFYEYCTCRPYHGNIHYDYITTKQLDTLRSLLVEYHLQFPYDTQLGEYCQRAVDGKRGIFFASSYDRQRTDIHPQIELIRLIKSLAS